jgi:hypothetical protein
MSIAAPIAIPMRCSQTGRLFCACLVWNAQQSRFRFARALLPGSVPSSVVPVKAGTLSHSESDWSGFACPCCGHSVTWPQFVRCGTCQELVCGARCRRLQDGRFHFQCHDGCGGGGICSGHIESYDGVALGSRGTVIAEAVVVTYRY